MPFPYSLSISADTTGPPADPTAPGGLPAALEAALRSEALAFTQPDPLTLRVRKPWLIDWDRSNWDPWAYVSRGTLRIEPTGTGLRVHLTVSFDVTILLVVALAGLFLRAGLPWAAGVAWIVIDCTLIYLAARARMPEWLENVTRRSAP